jgi:hypothetical protein
MDSKFFRCIIFGSSGSGKTYLVLNRILPMLKNSYDNVIVFTRSHNNKQYRKAIKKIFGDYPTIINSNFKGNLKKIRVKQERNEDKELSKKEDHPVYRSNLLFIWDDILDESLFKDQDFMDQFTNMRHLQCSTIVLSQVSNKVINTQMKANTNYFIFFKLNNKIQRRMALNMIEEVVDWKFGSKDPAEDSKKIWNKNVIDKKYGYIVITDDNEIHLQL